MYAFQDWRSGGCARQAGDADCDRSRRQGRL